MSDPIDTPGPHPSFGALKQIEVGLLNIGYAEADPTAGPGVLLLLGWPYDIHSYSEVTPLLAMAGYRVIVPFLRGYGPTRFLADETIRNGQQSAIAADSLALLDALRIEHAIIAGFDWGARMACIVAALWPERAKPGRRQDLHCAVLRAGCVRVASGERAALQHPARRAGQ